MNAEKYRKKLLQLEQELLTNIQRTGSVGREQPVPGALDPGDESIISEQKESSFAQADRDTQLLNEVQAALRRIEEGTFGRCSEDGEPIDSARLEALPWARYCRRHQEIRDAEAAEKRVTL